MKTKFSKIGKWVLFCALGFIGCLAFLVLVGENDEMPLGRFFLLKIAAMVVLALCVFGYKKMYAAGLLPERVRKDIEEDEI